MLWIKAFHLIFVVCWFAGIFYLPRLFVNIALVEDSTTRNHLLVMAQKLYRFMTPLGILAIGFGVWLVLLNSDYYLSVKWMHAKLTLVAMLIVYHFLCSKHLKRFLNGQTNPSHIYYRWFNEVPVLILFTVIILAVVRPI